MILRHFIFRFPNRLCISEFEYWLFLFLKTFPERVVFNSVLFFVCCPGRDSVGSGLDWIDVYFPQYLTQILLMPVIKTLAPVMLSLPDSQHNRTEILNNVDTMLISPWTGLYLLATRYTVPQIIDPPSRNNPAIVKRRILLHPIHHWICAQSWGGGTAYNANR